MSVKMNNEQLFFYFHFIAPRGSPSVTVKPVILGCIASCRKAHTVTSHNKRNKENNMQSKSYRKPYQYIQLNAETHRGTDMNSWTKHMNQSLLQRKVVTMKGCKGIFNRFLKYCLYFLTQMMARNKSILWKKKS